MAYTGSGQLIQATDYNGIVSTTVGGNIAFVMGTGQGQYGYGQSTSLISTISATNTVTAAQWAGLFYMMNRALGHQGSTRLAGGSNLNAVSGSTITYFANVTTAATSIFTNAATFGAQGTTTTGTTDSTNPTAAATSSLSYFRDVNVTFASVQAARYFFNAGGQINYVCSATDAAGTTRSTTLRDMVNQIGGLTAFRNTTNGGRTGTGGTITQNTSFGYRNMIFNTPTSLVNNDVAGTYSAHDVQLQVFTGSNDTTSGANGSQVVIRLLLTAPADDAFGGAINLTLSVRADVVFPETTYLTDVWGTPTITFDST